MAETAKKMLKEGKGPASNGGAAAIGGVGLARAAGMADVEAKEAAEDERYLRKVRSSTYINVCVRMYLRWGCSLLVLFERSEFLIQLHPTIIWFCVWAHRNKT